MEQGQGWGRVKGWVGCKVEQGQGWGRVEHEADDSSATNSTHKFQVRYLHYCLPSWAG